MAQQGPQHEEWSKLCLHGLQYLNFFIQQFKIKVKWCYETIIAWSLMWLSFLKVISTFKLTLVLTSDTSTNATENLVR